MLKKEHNEAGNVSYNAIDFANLDDGIYLGVYNGGMYEWRSNQIKITVENGQLHNIVLVEAKDYAINDDERKILFSRVIEEQSLNIDTISGATLTSNAYLKGIEDALKKAEKQKEVELTVVYGHVIIEWSDIECK